MEHFCYRRHLIIGRKSQLCFLKVLIAQLGKKDSEQNSGREEGKAIPGRRPCLSTSGVWGMMDLLWETEGQFGKARLGAEASWRPEVCDISWISEETLEIIK